MRIGNKCFYWDATKSLFVNKFLKHKNKDRKIRVGFIIRELAVLNKSQSIIDELSNDDRFEVQLLCIPCDLIEKDSKYNDTYNLCLSLGYDNLINLLKEDGSWLAIKNLDLDYVFYNSPYNDFYPYEYKSKNVSKYSKICVLLYAMTLSKNEVSVTLNKDFFKYVYYYFAEVEGAVKYNSNRFLLTHLCGLQKTKFFGMPALGYFFNRKSKASKSWMFSKNNFRVIWTPRWTTNKALGGSNFFEYKDKILSFFENHKNVDLLIRPHPLMFLNFLETGELTTKDYNDFIDKVNSMPNVDIDSEKEYVDTFHNSNILISDYSSVITEYLMTGKPVIYCKNNMILELTDDGTKFINMCYCAENSSDLFAYLQCLIDGIDEMKEVREAKVEEIGSGIISTSTKNIIKELVDDYYA